MPTADTPNFTNAWYEAMLPTWQFLEDLLEGQDTVKSKDTAYLMQEPAELADDYNRRLNRSLFFEDYRDCVINLTGMVFRKPPVLGDDVPELIRGKEAVKDDSGLVTSAAVEGLAESIDNAGTHINIFLQRVFEDAFFGHSFIVVDMPAADPNVQTAADERAAGGRPYWCMRKVIDTPNWRTEVINGRTALTQITFREITCEPDGLFGEIEVVRFRVYRLNEFGNAEWQIWVESAVDGEEIKVVLNSSGPILTKKGVPLKRLPVAVHYGEYEGFLQSRPPLKGIADINLGYYQKYSDLTSIEHHTCAVTLALIGVDDQSGDVTMGGNRVIYLPMGADAKFLEVNGDSIPALERDLDSLEKRMVHKGLDFVQEDHRVPATATEVMLAYTQRTSKLSRMVRSLIDCAEEALSITAEMEGLPEGGSITLGVDENSLTLTPAQLQVYSAMNVQDQLTLPTLWAMMERADLLPEDFSPQNEEKALQDAQQRRAELEAKQFDSGVVPPRLTTTLSSTQQLP
jgi:hypothetical protein